MANRSNAVLARSTHALGKCDSEIKAPCPEPLVDAVRSMAAAHGKTLAETARDMLTERTFGKLFVVRNTLGMTDSPARRISAEDALNTLATLHGLTRDEYVEQVLHEHIFGSHGQSVRHP